MDFQQSQRTADEATHKSRSRNTPYIKIVPKKFNSWISFHFRHLRAAAAAAGSRKLKDGRTPETQPVGVPGAPGGGFCWPRSRRCTQRTVGRCHLCSVTSWRHILFCDVMTSYFVLWRHDVIFCSVTSWRHILSRDVHLVSLFGVSWVSWLETLLCSVTSYLVTWRHNLRCPVPSRKVWFPKTAWCVLSTKTEEKPPIYGWRCVSLEFLPEFPDENHNQWAQEAAYGSWFLSECPISAAKKKKKKKNKIQIEREQL